MNKMTMTQYNVVFENAPEQYAKLTKLLAHHEVDTARLVSASDDEQTAVQFLAPKDPALKARLEKAGMRVREDVVFQLEMPNRHWELHKLAQGLAEQDIRIISLYSAVEGDSLRLVLAVDQPANALEAASKMGFDANYLVA